MPSSLQHLALDLQSVAEQDHDQGDERQVLHKPRLGTEADQFQTAVSDHEPGQHEQSGKREERALSQPRGQCADDQQPAEEGGGSLGGGHALSFSCVGYVERKGYGPDQRGYIGEDLQSSPSRGGGQMAAKDRIGKAS